MDTVRRHCGLAVVAALGLIGLQLAHVLEYLALVPDGHRRADVLAATGHQYLPAAVSAGAFLAAVALAVVFFSGIHAGTGRRRRGRLVSEDCVRFLPVAQALAFVVVEVAERLAVGSSLSDLGPVLVLGLPLQVVAGLVGGRVLQVFGRAGQRIGRILSGRTPVARPRPARAGWQRPAAAVAPVSFLPGGPTPARGPPLFVAVA